MVGGLGKRLLAFTEQNARDKYLLLRDFYADFFFFFFFFSLVV